MHKKCIRDQKLALVLIFSFPFLTSYELTIPKYEQDLAEIDKQMKQLKQSVVSEEKFLKLMENLVNYIGEIQDLEQLDEILGKFYSNFVINNHSVSVITFNTEWYDVLNPACLPTMDSN